MVASRNYLYAAMAGYEVMAAGDSARYHSFSGHCADLNPCPNRCRDQKINYPLGALLAYCKLGESVTFPAGQYEILGGQFKEARC